MSSLNHMLGVLDLFTEAEPIWTINEATESLGQSRSTIYRYFRALTRAGLLVPISSGAYALGPFIVKLDRQIRLSDPLLRVAPALMAKLRQKSGNVVILGRFFHTSVLCIHQEGDPDDIAVTFDRGRTMPLFRGATPKVILANLPVRVLKDIYLAHGEKIREAGLGGDWNEFRANLRKIRKAGFYVTPGGEVDHAVTGIAAPIFDKQKEILASVTLAVSERHCTPEMVESFVEMVRATAQEITEEVARLEDSLGSKTADNFAPAAAG